MTAGRRQAGGPVRTHGPTRNSRSHVGSAVPARRCFADRVRWWRCRRGAAGRWRDAAAAEHDRWAWLLRSANRSLSELSPARNRTNERWVRSSRWPFRDTRCALAQDELGLATFDELQKKGPPNCRQYRGRRESEIGSKRVGAVSFDISSGRSGSSRVVAAVRPPALPDSRSITRLCAGVPDIMPDAAEKLARICWTRKRTPSRRASCRWPKPLRAGSTFVWLWRTASRKPRCGASSLQAMLSEVLGRPIVLGQGEPGVRRCGPSCCATC